MVVDPSKKLIKLEIEFDRMHQELATSKQYELLTKVGIWRAFLNGYTGRGMVIFDETKLSREEILKILNGMNAKITNEAELTVEELLESSYSWNNILGQS